MAGLDSIPDEMKWRIAAEFSAQMPARYDRAFRGMVGGRYDEIEQEIWVEAAQTLYTIAKNLSLPLGSAEDLAETMRTVMVILFGPEFKSETLEIAKNRAVIIVKRCPLIDESYTIGTDGDRTFRKCMALILTGIPGLNKDFSARFIRAMCSGDRQCEIKVSENEPKVPDNKIKK